MSRIDFTSMPTVCRSRIADSRPEGRPLHFLNRLLLRDRALARALPRPGVGAGPLPAHRQVAAVPQPAIAADLHQPLDVHRDLLPEIALHAADVLEHAADLPHI